MNSEGLTYNALPAPRRRPQYGDVHLSDEPSGGAEAHRLGRGTHWTLAVAIFTPVLAAYGSIAYGLYLTAEGLL